MELLLCPIVHSRTPAFTFCLHCTGLDIFTVDIVLSNYIDGLTNRPAFVSLVIPFRSIMLHQMSSSASSASTQDG
eukprot:756207-Hanusia_phi.AAC.6